MEDLELSGLPENWLSLKPISSSGEEEEDDGKVILELRLGSNSSDQDSPKPFGHRRPMNRSSETAVNDNRTSTSFPPEEEEETTCPVCYKSFRSMKAMHGHMRCHPERGWRGANPPPPPPLLPPSSALSASSPPPIWVVRGKRGQKGSISNSSKKLKMDGKGASSGSTDEENYDSWKEFLTLGLNSGEEKEKESEMKKKEKEEASSSSSTSVVEEKEKEEGHKCKICKKSFLTGQALGGHQTTHRRRNARPRVPADFVLNQLN